MTTPLTYGHPLEVNLKNNADTFYITVLSANPSNQTVSAQFLEVLRK